MFSDDNDSAAKMRNARNVDAYAEGCNAIRHYSNASLAVRVMPVVQGIALLAVWAVCWSENEKVSDVGLPLFGLVLAASLFRFHMVYFKATEQFYKIVKRMEQGIFDPSFRPFSEYDECHGDWYGTAINRFTILHVPFTFMGLACFAAFLVGAARHFL